MMNKVELRKAIAELNERLGLVFDGPVVHGEGACPYRLRAVCDPRTTNSLARSFVPATRSSARV